MKKTLSKLRAYFSSLIIDRIESYDKRLEEAIYFKNSSIRQLSLIMNYKSMAEQKEVKPLSFKDVGFREYSQHEEDGILLYIFSLIGTTNKKFVEMCAGNGLECNTTNLVINHRWTGAMFDGNEENVKKGHRFFSQHKDSMYWTPNFVHSWIDKENINQLIEQADIKGEIDLFSLDIDGNDYWLLQELNIINPRVIVLEFNHLWGAEEAVTVPYNPSFVAEFSEYGSDYAGASLAAFVKLGKEKGYRLVGTNQIATNAFFVRNDIVHDWLPEIDVKTCFEHPRAKFGMQQRFQNIKNKKWEKV